MSAHPEFADDLALYALGSLSEQESAALEAHLATCSECRAELARLRGDMALLALSASSPAPPARARARLLSAIRPAPALVLKPVRRNWWFAAGWVFAAAMAVLAAFFWSSNVSLEQRIATMHVSISQLSAELQDAHDLVGTLSASDAMRVTLVAAKTPPQPQGRVIYVQNQGRLIFIANNLAPVPPQKAYELWLLPVKGFPIAAGVFKPDAHGSATVVNPPLPVDTEAKGFAITLEPESGSPAPTSAVLMVGTGE